MGLLDGLLGGDSNDNSSNDDNNNSNDNSDNSSSNDDSSSDNNDSSSNDNNDNSSDDSNDDNSNDSSNNDDNEEKQKMKLFMTEEYKLPILTLTNTFIEKNTLWKTSVDALDSESDPVDGSGKDMEFTKIAIFNNVNTGPHAFYHITKSNTVVDIPIVMDGTDDYFKRTMKILTPSYNPNFEIKDNIQGNLILPKSMPTYDIAKPTNDVGDSIDIHILGTKNIFISNRITYFEFMEDGVTNKGLSNGNFLVVAKIKASDIGWDTTKMKLYTLYNYRPDVYDLEFVGGQDVEYVYLPLS